MPFTYIIESVSTRRFYVGSASNIEKRLADHNAKRVRSTKAFAPYKLVYAERFSSTTAARQREYQIKRSGHIQRFLHGRGPIV